MTEIVNNKRVSKLAKFSHYIDGNLVYNIDGFEFPISIEEAKDGCFGRDVKAITLMRWVRKHLEMLNSKGIIF